MPDPIVLITDKGSIELRPGAGDCIAEGCRKMGGNKVTFIVHNTEYEHPIGFNICGDHFAKAVGRMLAEGPAEYVDG